MSSIVDVVASVREKVDYAFVTIQAIKVVVWCEVM